MHIESIKGFRAWIKTLSGQRITVVVKKWARKRSTNQNRFWWGVVVPMFAERCGYQPWEHEAVHDELMRVLLGMREGGHAALPIRESSAKLTTAEFNVLIERAQVFAAEKLGLVIPDP